MLLTPLKGWIMYDADRGRDSDRRGIIDANAAKLAMEFSQKRTDLKNKILREKDDVPSATDLAQVRVSFEQVKGKRLWGLLNEALVAQQKNPMYLLTRQTDALKIDTLAEFAADAWPPHAQQPHAAAIEQVAQAAE